MQQGIGWNLSTWGVDRDRLRHVTLIVHCHWWKCWSRDTDVSIILSILSIKNEKLLNSNYNNSKPKLFRLLWVIAVFRLVWNLQKWSVYNLDSCTKSHIKRVWYNFDTILCQFLETGTSGRTLIGLDQLLKCLSSSLSNTPFHFSLTVPLRWP